MLAVLKSYLPLQRIIFWTQWIIPFTAIWFILIIIGNKTGNSSFAVILEDFLSGISIYAALFIISLTGVNLFFESLRWYLVIRKLKKISIAESFIQTLLAMAAGFITPFRSGALLSRFFSNEEADKTAIINGSLQMAVSQFLVTFTIGFAGVVFLFHDRLNPFFQIVSIVVSMLFFIYCVHYYLKHSEFKIAKRDWLSIRPDAILLLFSFLRYLVFAFQYILLLHLFGVHHPLIDLMALVAVTYLVNSSVPAGILGKIGIRELSAIVIIGESTGFILETSVAAFVIWILNQAVPALSGSLIYLTRNLRPN